MSFLENQRLVGFLINFKQGAQRTKSLISHLIIEFKNDSKTTRRLPMGSSEYPSRND